jgi:hypothetical protein
MSIVSGRIAIIAMAIFVSAVLAYPCGTKEKVTGGPKLPGLPETVLSLARNRIFPCLLTILDEG